MRRYTLDSTIECVKMTQFIDLPDDTVYEIMSYLSGIEILKLCTINVRTADLCRYAGLWRDKIRQEYLRPTIGIDPHQQYKNFLTCERTAAIKFITYSPDTHLDKDLYLTDGVIPMEVKYNPKRNNYVFQSVVIVTNNRSRGFNRFTIHVRRGHSLLGSESHSHTSECVIMPHSDTHKTVRHLLASGYHDMCVVNLMPVQALRYHSLGVVKIV